MDRGTKSQVNADSLNRVHRTAIFQARGTL